MQQAVKIKEPTAVRVGGRRPGRPARRGAASAPPLARLGLLLVTGLVLGTWAAGLAVVAHDARHRALARQHRDLVAAEALIAGKFAAAAEELRGAADLLAASPELRAAVAARQHDALQGMLAAAAEAGGWDLLAVTDYLGRVLASAGTQRPQVLTAGAVESALAGAPAETFLQVGGELFHLRVAPVFSGDRAIGALALGRRLDDGLLRVLRGGLAPHLVLSHGGRLRARTGPSSAGAVETEIELGTDEAGAPVVLSLLPMPGPATTPADLPWAPLAAAAGASLAGALLVGSVTLRPHRDRLRALSRHVRRMVDGRLEEPVPRSGCRELQELAAELEQMRAHARDREEEAGDSVRETAAALKLERQLREGAEERLSRARQDLAGQQRLVRLGRAAAELAHEIANPTATITSTVTGIRHALDELLGCLQRITDRPLPAKERRLFFAALEEAGRADAGGPAQVDEEEVAEIAGELAAAGCREPEAAARSMARAGLARWWHRLVPLIRRDEGPALMSALETQARLAVHLRSARTAAGAAQEVVRSLRSAVGGAHVDRAQAVDVRQGVQDAVALLEHEMRGRIRLSQRIGALPPVRGDAGELRQVWTNLIHNAVRAMCHGGGTLGLAARQQGPWIVVEVTDTGAGIAAEVRDRIFESEITTRRDSGGSGLGLAIVRRIVEAHGGRISVESRPGWTRFEVRLPIAAATAGGPA